MLIYKATNLINNKSYIGQTIFTLNKRKYSHADSASHGSNYAIHRAIRKYGEENFKWEVLCECDTIEVLNEKEQFYIKEYKTFGKNGYNMTKGGCGSLGYVASDETREKLRKAMIGRKLTDEWKQKISKAHIGKPKSEKHRLSMMGRVGINNLGKKHSEETKRKISEAHKGKVFSKETIEKMKINNTGEGNPFYGKKHSEETKRKMSEARKGWHKNNKKQSVGLK